MRVTSGQSGRGGGIQSDGGGEGSRKRTPLDLGLGEHGKHEGLGRRAEATSRVGRL